MARYAGNSSHHQSSGTAAGAASAPESNSQSFKVNRRGLLITVKFLTWAGLGFVALLNVQPWIELAKQISKQLTNIPFVDSITAIPFLGGWIEWGVVNIVSLIGIVLWGITQLMELLPNLVNNPSKEIINYRWVAYGFEAFICFLRFPPYEGGLDAIIADFPEWDASLIDWWLLSLFLVTMFSVELIFHLVRNIRANIK